MIESTPHQYIWAIYITGDVWQSDATRKAGPQEVLTVVNCPDLRVLMADYERRYGKCGSFDIKVVK